MCRSPVPDTARAVVRRLLRGAATLAGLVPLHLPAQSPTQRAEIEIFRDSLAPLRDSASLVVAERDLIARASHLYRDTAMVHLRLGFLALRLGDLGGKQHYNDAASEFQWVVDLQPKWPYGWFGLGLAELGVGDAGFAPLRGLQMALGKDALTRSANNFAHSAEVDPEFVRGLVELSNTALRQRVNVRLGVALAALRRSAGTAAARNPEVELVRARVEREVGSPDSALAAVDALLAQRPDGPTALLEQARVRFKLGRRDGGDPWYRGLALADPAALALYRTDLRFILPDSTLRAFDAAAPRDRVELMHRFWEQRDDDQLHAHGERLEEHYRRLDVARHDYRLASTSRHYDIVERYRPPVAEFDDRGVVYIRQGTPDERASLDLPGLAYNESWVYHRTDGPDLLLHFVAREGVTDFRLVESVLDILGHANTVRLENSGDIQGTDAPLMPLTTAGGPVSADSAARLRQHISDATLSRESAVILRSRQPLDPIYSRMLASGHGGASGLQAEERARGRESLLISTTTDRWERRYDHAFPATVAMYAASQDSVRPMVRIAYAVPVDSLPAGLRDRLAPRVRVSVLTPDGRTNAVVDTVGDVVAGTAAGGGRYLFGSVSVGVPPGRQTVRVGLEAGQSGVVTSRDTVEVAGPADSSLTLSDLVLGARSVPVRWQTGPSDTTWVNPLQVFRLGEPVTLSFDVDGLRPDSTVRLELVIKRADRASFFKRLLSGIFGGGGATFHATVTERASGRHQVVHRDITLDKWPPARYVLEVSLSNGSGPTVTRRQEFTVVQ
jgi:tetratricopeptide (TPR) repeat protein